MTRTSAAGSIALGGDALWFKDAVIYEAHVRSFRDSDGDGVGDFRGMTQKLDYIQDLGVTALWLLPFYPSPLRDDGYDISDYRRIHPSYGTLRDFRALLAEAHERNIRVITELVLAHTSDQHPWFRRARLARPGSSQRDFYVWSDTPDRYRDARVIFTDFETSNWAYDTTAGAYFFHRFYSHQPSLNYDNPEVHEAMLAVVDFWLEMGVDGLRLDAVPYLYAREHTTCENLPETFEFLRELRRHVDDRFEGRMLLAEANQWPEDATAYFSEGKACHMAFHFPLMPRMFMAARQEDRFPIVDILTETPPIPENCQWALFLRNHDELTLEMVTDEERDYMYRAYADDPQARVNVGIRRRLAPLLGNDRKLIEMMNGLLFSMPGTPILYYGDEIGMGDNIYLGDRNAVRTPMQWDGDRNAGFSEANPQRLYLPVIIDPEYHVQAVNVASQQENPNSLLWWMRRLVALRTRHHAFARGTFELLLVDNRKVLAFLRRDEEETILVIVNLSRFAQGVELDLSSFRGRVPVELFGDTEFPAIGDLPYFLTLGGHGFYWFSLTAPEDSRATETPRINTSGLTGVFGTNRRAELEQALIRHIAAARWFREKTRSIRRAEIVDRFSIADGGAMQIVVVELAFDHGSTERYVVPLTTAEGERAEDLRRFHHEMILAELNGGAVLYDATADPAFAPALLELLRRRQVPAVSGRTRGESGRLRSLPAPPLRRALASVELGAGGSLIGADHSNTSLLVGGEIVVKLLRRVEAGVNPDVEIGRFLNEHVRYEHAPAILGSIDYESSGTAGALAIFQQFVANEGDGWNYVLDALRRGLDDAVAHPDAQSLGSVPPASLDPFEHAPEVAAFLIGPHQQWAELLGRRTAELHVALSSSSDDPAFNPAPLTAIDRQAMLHSARGLWRRTARAARAAAAGDELLTRVLDSESEILERFEVIRSMPVEVAKIRIHGDYHLGQVLWTGKDFTIIDFEGEPDRSIATRRLKRNALVDVAGMVRSFHYASRVAALRLERDTPAAREHEVIDRLLLLWYRYVTGTFVSTYLDVVGEAPFVPADREERRALLDFALLEKAVYEIGYELNSRPELVSVPARGILDILGQPT